MRQKIGIFTKTISCSSSVLTKRYGPLIWLPEGALRHLKALRSVRLASPPKPAVCRYSSSACLKPLEFFNWGSHYRAIRPPGIICSPIPPPSVSLAHFNCPLYIRPCGDTYYGFQYCDRYCQFIVFVCGLFVNVYVFVCLSKMTAQYSAKRLISV